MSKKLKINEQTGRIAKGKHRKDHKYLSYYIKKWNNKLKDTKLVWPNYVFKEMEQGASIEEIKALLQISDNLHYRLLREEDEYAAVIEYGKMLSKAWWYKAGRTNLKDKDFNFTGWYMNMKNRFKWKDRQDVTSDDEGIQVNVIDYHKNKIIDGNAVEDAEFEDKEPKQLNEGDYD